MMGQLERALLLMPQSAASRVWLKAYRTGRPLKILGVTFFKHPVDGKAILACLVNIEDRAELAQPLARTLAYMFLGIVHISTTKHI